MSRADFEVGDRVKFLLRSRSGGKVGGWKAVWVEGEVVKLMRVNVVVKHEYFYGEMHTVRRDRIRKAIETG